MLNVVYADVLGPPALTKEGQQARDNLIKKLAWPVDLNAPDLRESWGDDASAQASQVAVMRQIAGGG